MNFDKLEWHDAEILDIDINRENPGMVDEVALTIKWPDESTNLLVFENCYRLVIEMNFGIVSPENVLTAYMSDNIKELSSIQELWKSYDIDLEELKYYEIETNSTNSFIKIFAMGFYLAPTKQGRG